MRHMGYHWDDNLKVYLYKMKGFCKVIYNYNDPVEFGTTNIEEKQVEDQVHLVDTDMDDTHHDDNYAFLHGT